jgi:hypothetical protein
MPTPTPAPPDRLLPILCVLLAVAVLVLLIAPPVGLIIMIASSTLWVIMKAREIQRRVITRRFVEEDYKRECKLMDAAYAEQCRPIELANNLRTDAWTAAYATMTAEHQKRCKAIDEKNKSLTAAFETENAARQAVYDKARQMVEDANRIALDAWEAENASRTALYNSARMKIESANQVLIDAWELANAAREIERERACREVDEENRRRIAVWEAANAPWLSEQRLWRERVARTVTEIRRLEVDLYSKRTAAENEYRQRKDRASGIASSYDRTRHDYENELRQAEVDSKRIQLEEYLDKALIRQAKLKGITGERILSLESFGIETAKDVGILNHQKVPGIGPVLSKRLFDWRSKLTTSFRPQQTLPDSVKNHIASRYSPVMLPLGQSIQEGINDLDTIALSHRARESELLKSIAAAVQKLAVAEAHVTVMKL